MACSALQCSLQSGGGVSSPALADTLRRCWAGAWIHLSQSCRLDIQKWWFMHLKYADREVSFPVISPGCCFVKFLISSLLSFFWSASHWISSLVASEPEEGPSNLCLAGCHCFSAESLLPVPANAMFGMQHFQDDRPIFSLAEKRNVSYQPGALEVTCHPQPLFPTRAVPI